MAHPDEWTPSEYEDHVIYTYQIVNSSKTDGAFSHKESKNSKVASKYYIGIMKGTLPDYFYDLFSSTTVVLLQLIFYT